MLLCGCVGPQKAHDIKKKSGDGYLMLHQRLGHCLQETYIIYNDGDRDQNNLKGQV